MPVLRYYVSANPNGLQVATRTAGDLKLLSPQAGEALFVTQKVIFC